jgi:hypothetical protein
MIPAMPPLIILGKRENCCALATPVLVVLELNAEDEEDEEDIFAVEMVTTEGFGDDVTPAVVVASLDFIADSLRQPVTAVADCCVAQAKAHFYVAQGTLCSLETGFNERAPSLSTADSDLAGWLPSLKGYDVVLQF